MDVSDKVAVLKIADKTPDQKTVERARELLARCESGEITGFTAVVELGLASYQFIASGVTSRHMHAGYLLEAAIARLGFHQDD